MNLDLAYFYQNYHFSLLLALPGPCLGYPRLGPRPSLTELSLISPKGAKPKSGLDRKIHRLEEFLT